MPYLSKLLLLVAIFSLSSARAFGAAVYLHPGNPYPSGEYASEVLEKRTVSVHSQKWFRLSLDPQTFVWTPEEFVLTREDLASDAYLKESVPLQEQAFFKSSSIMRLESGSRVVVKGRVGVSWVKVQIQGTDDFTTGYVLRSALIMQDDLKEGEVLFVRDDAPLRSAPVPEADIRARSKRWAHYKFTETAWQKWGRVVLREHGELWWPLDQEILTHSFEDGTKISTNELFMKYKIHDIASSPVLPNLKILSAQGVFRTVDGNQWEKLPQFKNENYAVAISPTGRVFVGTLMSDDHGESFHSFIRLERLIASLHARWKKSPRQLKILEIQPLGADGHKVQLKLDIGLQFPVEVATSDDGATWSAL